MPEPEPADPAVMLIHETELDALHEQPAAAVTVTDPVPALEVAEAVVGAATYVHVIPAWLTVNVCPAIVSVPVRDEVDVFAATL